MTLILDFISLVEEKTKDVKKNDETTGCIYSELRVPKYQRNHSYSGYQLNIPSNKYCKNKQNRKKIQKADVYDLVKLQ